MQVEMCDEHNECDKEHEEHYECSSLLLARIGQYIRSLSRRWNHMLMTTSALTKFLFTLI